jgi:antirestriction protein ArdC
MDGRIIKPLRHNSMSCRGNNFLMLWGAAIEGGYLSPFWLIYRQVNESAAHFRKGERGNIVIYANTITKTGERDGSSEEKRLVVQPICQNIFPTRLLEYWQTLSRRLSC